jgi:hypothetical protein
MLDYILYIAPTLFNIWQNRVAFILHIIYGILLEATPNHGGERYPTSLA